MLKNENIVCISSIDWDFIWQGHQEIMSAFARNGNRVLFIENTGVRSPNFGDVNRLRKRISNWFRSTKGFRKEEDNIFVFSPVMLPFPYSKIASWINRRLLIEPLRRWAKAMSFHDPIVWTFLPTSIALDIINEFDDRKLLAYYDIADFGALTDNPKKLKKTEESVIKKCDIIFAQGRTIADKCKKLNSNVHIFPFGVNTKVFEDFLSRTSKRELADVENIKKPIIGYVGGVHKHVDVALLGYMAKTHPEWSIVLVGPKQADIREIEEMSNVFILGKKEFELLPDYIDRFDVCMIPYIVSDYTKTVYPTKLNEYFMMGKPVVSTALPEVEFMNESNNNMALIARTRKQFVKLVEKSLVSDSAKVSSERMAIAKKNGWSERIDRMSSLVEETITRKKEPLAFKWQEKFLMVYKKTRHNVVKSLAVILAAYLLIFYTPIFWMLAKPLIISEKPGKVDAIIVLGGGVGESGKVGQGYEERAQYAIDLYKKGYADHIVFSSGYINIFKETLVMKALAMSLGVPESAILLENRASNTYESVLFAKAIIGKEKWHSIILLSSPYHMLRVSKVFAKVGGDIDVLYAPVSKSSFYAHEEKGIFKKKITASQIGGIVHEYLGMLYYWWKGWI
jgi:uncharacterized SAM-binding protein YcdF (DUF218 family)